MLIGFCNLILLCRRLHHRHSLRSHVANAPRNDSGSRQLSVKNQQCYKHQFIILFISLFHILRWMNLAFFASAWYNDKMKIMLIWKGGGI